MPPKGSQMSKERFDNLVSALKRDRKVEEPYGLATWIAKGGKRKAGKKRATGRTSSQR